MPELNRVVDIYLFAPLFEMLPEVIFEAMSCNVCSAFSGSRRQGRSSKRRRENTHRCMEAS